MELIWKSYPQGVGLYSELGDTKYWVFALSRASFIVKWLDKEGGLVEHGSYDSLREAKQVCLAMYLLNQ